MCKHGSVCGMSQAVQKDPDWSNLKGKNGDMPQMANYPISVWYPITPLLENRTLYFVFNIYF